MPPSPLNYEDNATAMIVGVGLMGQHMASNIIPWLNLKKLILVDQSTMIGVGTSKVVLADYASSISQQSDGKTEVVGESVDIFSFTRPISHLFARQN